jgi:hypothetical protein
LLNNIRSTFSAKNYEASKLYSKIYINNQRTSLFCFNSVNSFWTSGAVTPPRCAAWIQKMFVWYNPSSERTLSSDCKGPIEVQFVTIHLPLSRLLLLTQWIS